MKYNHLNKVNLKLVMAQSVEHAISILADDIVSIMLSLEMENINDKPALDILSENNSKIAHIIDETLNKHRKMMIEGINQAFDLDNGEVRTIDD